MSQVLAFARIFARFSWPTDFKLKKSRSGSVKDIQEESKTERLFTNW